jgi:hypothetical protein
MGRHVYVDGGVGVCSTALREAVESAVCKSKSGIVKMPPAISEKDKTHTETKFLCGSIECAFAYVQMLSIAFT